GDKAVAVANQDEVAIALELVARIGDDAVVRGFDRRPLGYREIDAVVLQAIRLGTEAGNDAAAHRPPEARHTTAGIAGFCAGLLRRDGCDKPRTVRRFRRCN